MMQGMPHAIIADTSCLIMLDKINRLNVLQNLFETVFISEIIALEFKKPLPTFIKIENPNEQDYLMVLSKKLDKGEASAIALAMRKTNPLLILDELKGRNIAKILGFEVTGTVGVLIEAKRSNLIPELKAELVLLKENGFYLSENVFKEALFEVGE